MAGSGRPSTMLYDPRWEKRFEPTPPPMPPRAGSDRSWFIAVLGVPVVILGSTAAGALQDVRYLVVPLAANVVGWLWSLCRDRA